jgi:membrane fusion protein (multidrug efflux system)
MSLDDGGPQRGTEGGPSTGGECRAADVTPPGTAARSERQQDGGQEGGGKPSGGGREGGGKPGGAGPSGSQDAGGQDAGGQDAGGQGGGRDAGGQGGGTGNDQGGKENDQGGKVADQGGKENDQGGKGGDPGSKGNDKGGQDGKPRSKKPLIIIGAIVVVAAITALIYWFLHRNQVTTDDAYTDGNVITMVPKVSGYVVGLYVNDNSLVKKGDVLVRIDPRDYQAAKAQAEAQLALSKAQLRSAQDSFEIARVQYPAQLASAEAQRQAAQATLVQAEEQYRRQHEVDRRATTQENIDQSTSQQLSSAANVKSASAQVAIARLVPEQIRQAASVVAEREASVRAAEAQLEQADLNLSYTELVAPVDGFITMRSAQLGGYLATNQTAFVLVTTEVWVTANFKESQLGRMRVGDKADVTVDAYSAIILHGHVQSIQYGTGSRFSAFPAENATGNFVKIVQRVPVKIVIDDGLDPNRPLPIGLSVDPVVFIQ